jgi:hypothetical protein
VIEYWSLISSFYCLFVKKKSHPFSFFDLMFYCIFLFLFYCIFSFFIWFFIVHCVFPSFFCTCFILFFYSGVVSCLSYLNLLKNKRLTLVGSLLLSWLFCYVKDLLIAFVTLFLNCLQYAQSSYSSQRWDSSTGCLIALKTMARSPWLRACLAWFYFTLELLCSKTLWWSNSASEFWWYLVKKNVVSSRNEVV